MGQDALVSADKSAARLEALQGQVEELEALEACFPEGLLLAPPESDNLRFARAVVGDSRAAEAAHVPALSATLRLPGVSLAGAPVELAFVLPRLAGAPRLQVHTAAARDQGGRLQQIADSTAAECAVDGAPCLLLVADQLMEAARELAEQQGRQTAGAGGAAERQQGPGQAPAAAAAQRDGTSAGGGSREKAAAGTWVLSRRCLVFHHIKNLGKRKSIVQWGGELRLGGWSKPGFPGVVLVEGQAEAVADYVARLRQLRWQSMAVRAEEDVALASREELEAARRAPPGVQELGEEDMDRLAAAAREAGMDGLFREAFRLGPTAG